MQMHQSARVTVTHGAPWSWAWMMGRAHSSGAGPPGHEGRLFGVPAPRPAPGPLSGLATRYGSSGCFLTTSSPVVYSNRN